MGLIKDRQALNDKRTRPADVGGVGTPTRTREIPLTGSTPAFAGLEAFDLADSQSSESGRRPGIRCGEADMTIDCVIARGELRITATLKDVHPADFTSLSCTSEGVCIAEQKIGIYVIKNERVDLLRLADGLPSDEVKSTGWLDGMLYLGFDGCLAKFDPAARSFKILSSTRAIAPRNSLDGGAQYCVTGILADSARHCVWFTVHDISSSRATASLTDRLWKYDRAAEKHSTLIESGDRRRNGREVRFFMAGPAAVV